jgi:hypothetical protein
MNTYRVMMLGPSGSGKTVYLGSLFRELSIQGERGFFLGADNKARKKLNEIYTQIVVGKKWPKGNEVGDEDDAEDWVFTGSISTSGKTYDACEFIYIDYAGGRITESNMEDDSDFNQKLESADVMLGLLDGKKICELMNDTEEGELWALRDLQNMLEIMMKNIDKPIHFVISKWDLFQSRGYSFKEVKEKLLKENAFKNLVGTRQANQVRTRLIPVSSVGQGFAKLLDDGTMEKVKGKRPVPFQVEVPLACVLPDMIESKKEELKRRRTQEASRSTTVKANLDWTEEYLAWVPFTDFAESAERKKREAEERSEELRRQKNNALNKIDGEKTALESVIRSFIVIENQFKANFPDSYLS